RTEALLQRLGKLSELSAGRRRSTTPHVARTWYRRAAAILGEHQEKIVDQGTRKALVQRRHDGGLQELQLLHPRRARDSDHECAAADAHRFGATRDRLTDRSAPDAPDRGATLDAERPVETLVERTRDRRWIDVWAHAASLSRASRV